ncbi:MAG: hypothetical protein JRH20_11515 [Deltaproteobacteria bacterium]|nr:hypothetical protein [Deltaproteobacteria bacterium]
MTSSPHLSSPPAALPRVEGRVFPTQVLAVISTASMAASLLVHGLGGSAALRYPFFALAAASIAALLWRVYTLAWRVEGDERSLLPRYKMRAHVLLHGVPASYLLVQLLVEPSLLVNLIYLVPVLLFFFTGRLTWGAFRQRYTSKMYVLFFKGNSGMMIGLVVFSLIGLFFDEAFGRGAFQGALVGYFSVHLLLVGVAMIKLERDILS